ncbi:uncharacterized protein LOC130691548 isoform X2 [Daphnia carinata]|uniref:uncharacterized protein LOC130691548 isoform X2 n=1 Tax=Daphnia carinata TaxID=120202 RepID=UPI00257A283A|nr:uncharacterized protein LOC130691548 isoform X2 [Daphnia carinata]
MQISQIIVALAMGCLVAGSPVPSETPSARNDQIAEAREHFESPIHQLEADEAIPAEEVASDIASQAEIYADRSALYKYEDEPESSVRQYGIAIPELKLTQFQRSDDEGRYSFGYAYPGQVRMESRNEDGVVTGSYYYNDPNGTPNQVQYMADGSGFRVAANNLPVHFPGHQPQDTPEVEEARRKHLEAFAAIAQQNKAQDKKESTVQKVETVVEDESRDAVITDALETDEVKATVEKLQSFTPAKIEQNAVELNPSNRQPSIKPLDPDVIIDDENQAIITEQDTDANAGIFELDAEPIRLLAQLYAKHVEDAEPPQPIERPAGFHPQNLRPPSGFDLFSRLEGDDRQAIEITNPEFVDLRAFLLTNRIRASQIPQLLSQKEEKQQGKPSKFDDNADLFSPEEADEMIFDDEDVVDANDLYNYYFNIANGGVGGPVLAVNRESLSKLPESLQLALTGMGAIDGHHNAQSMPSQQIQQKQQLLNQQRFASNYINQRLGYNSPYSSLYSPYYFYRQNAHMSPYKYHANPYSSYYRLPLVTPYASYPYTNYNPYHSY